MLLQRIGEREPRTRSPKRLTHVPIRHRKVTERVVAQVADFICERVPQDVIQDVQMWYDQRKPRGIVVLHSTTLPRPEVVKLVQQGLIA